MHVNEVEKLRKIERKLHDKAIEKLVKKPKGDSITFSFNHSDDDQDSLELKFRNYAKKAFGDRQVPKIKVQKNASKPLWNFEIFLTKN